MAIALNRILVLVILDIRNQTNQRCVIRFASANVSTAGVLNQISAAATTIMNSMSTIRSIVFQNANKIVSSERVQLPTFARATSDTSQSTEVTASQSAVNRV